MKLEPVPRMFRIMIGLVASVTIRPPEPGATNSALLDLFVSGVGPRPGVSPSEWL
jgi:hypothetical protein